MSLDRWSRVRDEAITRLGLHIGETYTLTVTGSRGTRRLKNMLFVHANNYGLVFHRRTGLKVTEFTFNGPELTGADQDA